MTTTLTYTPGEISKQLKDMATGLTATPPQAVTSLLVNGKTFTMPELLAALTGYAAKYKATDDTYDAFRAALEKRAEIERDAEHLVQGLRTVLKGMFGKKSVALEAYGITPNKTPTPLTVEEDVVKVAKAKATRIARHTLGKRQKAKIKGELPKAPPPPAPSLSEE